jgi:hypothetical protein
MIHAAIGAPDDRRVAFSVGAITQSTYPALRVSRQGGRARVGQSMLSADHSTTHWMSFELRASRGDLENEASVLSRVGEHAEAVRPLAEVSCSGSDNCLRNRQPTARSSLCGRGLNSNGLRMEQLSVQSPSLLA